MKRKTKLEILLGNIDKASADLKKSVEESQKRLDESFAKYQHKVEVAHHNSMMVNEKQIEEIPCNSSEIC
jgi:predicted nucleic acid-binding OB-fold protein